MDIKIERTDKALSCQAGLKILKDLYSTCEKSINPLKFLQKMKSSDSGNLRKFKQLLFGFHAGADCLDDFHWLRHDEGFKAICDEKVYTAKSVGDFLRTFKPIHCKEMNHQLIKHSFDLRQNLFPDAKSITIDIDSTTNQQHGKKMEGVRKTYNGIFGLDTICAFDEYGFQYWNDVRPGATNTAQGSEEIIHAIFSRMPDYTHGLNRIVRADSGYCKFGFILSCMAHQINFVVSMRRLMFKPLISTVADWVKQDRKDKSRIMFKGERECEIGETIYQSDHLPHPLRVVLIRALKPGVENKLFYEADEYDYHGWVSNFSQAIEAVDVIKCYRGRGHAENYIRELKNGLDLHHYPCQKLLANKAFGLVAAFAYNQLRYVALKENKKHPQFSKAIRNRLVRLPCQVVRHAGEVIFRFMSNHYKEVSRWLGYIKNLQHWFSQKRSYQRKLAHDL